MDDLSSYEIEYIDQHKLNISDDSCDLSDYTLESKPIARYPLM